jgi:hypothetical protein
MLKGKASTPETRAKRSAAAKAVNARPEVKAKIRAGLKAAFARPEVQAKIRAGLSSATLFDSSSLNTHRCRVQRLLVNQRHNFRTQRPAPFLREGNPSHPKTAGPT